nr:MAG: hypothetical protein [Bacteriophage sp.]
MELERVVYHQAGMIAYYSDGTVGIPTQDDLDSAVGEILLYTKHRAKRIIADILTHGYDELKFRNNPTKDQCGVVAFQLLWHAQDHLNVFPILWKPSGDKPWHECLYMSVWGNGSDLRPV